MSKSFIEESKAVWVAANGADVSDNQIKIGCLQRIATSLEKMETPYRNLLKDVEFLSRRSKELVAETEHLSRCNSSLRGAITRLKKRK